jgi:hypothetical protein
MAEMWELYVVKVLQIGLPGLRVAHTGRTDYALEREIRSEILQQSVAAWEHMVSALQLGGRAGAEIPCCQ